MPAAELPRSLRSKEAMRQAPGRPGARHQEGGADTRPRSAWNVPGGRRPVGWARSPAGVRPLRERGRRRSPQSQARSGEKGQSLLTLLAELEPGAACRTHAAGAPRPSSPPPASALPRLIEGLGCLSWPVGAGAGVQSPIQAHAGPTFSELHDPAGTRVFQTPSFQSHPRSGLRKASL